MAGVTLRRGAAAAAAAGVALILFAARASQARATGFEIQPTPNPAGAVTAKLSAVSCPAAASCMAVGSYSPDGKQQLTLVERWDGIAWTILPSPNVRGTSDLLDGVSCTGPSWCMAVGEWFSGAGVKTLAEVWNGHRWAISLTPPPNPQSISTLTAVSCDARGSCTAVGSILKIGHESAQPLALHWDGTGWTAQTTPIPPEGEQGSGLQGVSCTAASACTAAGIFFYNDIYQGIFAERFDGVSWTLQSQPNPQGEHFNAEYAVSCVGAAFCMGVGSWLRALELETHTLAEAWNGSSWARLSTVRPQHAASAALYGVSCASASACAAVGEYTTSPQGTPTATLAEEWNGAGWALRRTQNPAGAQGAMLAGVSCQPGGCVAVGSSSTSNATQTLSERNAP